MAPAATRRIAQVTALLGLVATLGGGLSAAQALGLGAAVALTLGNPYLATTRQMTRHLLAVAVVGLGAGMDLLVVWRVGRSGFFYTAIGIALTLVLANLLGRFLRLPHVMTTLIGVGTAICGGSAIAAVAPVIGAKDKDVSVALGIVFLLNAAALVLFPGIGHALHLSQVQFAMWSALAIHDTSSVVAATMQYGNEALAMGTTVKLARALWIVPITLDLARRQRRDPASVAHNAVPSRPWFILGFVMAAAVCTFVPALQGFGQQVEQLARRLLVLALYLIGLNLTRQTVLSLGLRPMLLGVGLWVSVASATLWAIVWGWI